VAGRGQLLSGRYPRAPLTIAYHRGQHTLGAVGCTPHRRTQVGVIARRLRACDPPSQ
jgi:hypothetical protein